MNTLTKEQTARVFALYMPCMVQYAERGTTGTYALQGVSISEEMGLFEWDDDSDWWNLSDAKLMLKPLSSLTDEHAVEVAKIIGLKKESRNEVPIDAAWLEKERNQLMVAVEGFPTVPFDIDDINFEAADKLREWGYAIPYLGQDLYAAGIAITPEQAGT